MEKEKKKYLFLLSEANSNPMQMLGIMKVAANMKAFDDSIDLVIFLIGEGVELAKKGVVNNISIDFEGNKVNFGEMLELLMDLEVKIIVCHGFMPGYGLTNEDLIPNAEVKSSAYIGELLLQGYVPFSLNI